MKKYVKSVLNFLYKLLLDISWFIMWDEYTQHRKKGYSYFINKEYDRAIEEYKIALKLRPYYVDPHLELSRLYCNKGDIPTALSYAKKAVELADDSFMANDNLAYVYMKDNKYKDAVVVLERFLPTKLTKEQSITLYNMLGYASIYTAADAIAESYLFKALDLDPQNGTSLFNLALLSSRSGKDKLASEYLNRIVKYHSEYEYIDNVKNGLQQIEASKKNKAGSANTVKIP